MRIPPVASRERRGVPVPTDKTCARCGRAIAWRKKWERCWDEVKWCSDACRSGRVSPLDRRIEETMRAMLMARTTTATICPSDVVRALEEDWRPLMENARMAARRLVAEGFAEVTQGGRVVDPSTAKGPIRVRKKA